MSLTPGVLSALERPDLSNPWFPIDHVKKVPACLFVLDSVRSIHLYPLA